MVANYRIKKDDEVVVLTGKHKGQKGKVVKVLLDKERVIVSNVNMVKKHAKPSYVSQGGIIEKEASIHISNVAFVDPKSGEKSKLGIKHLEDGKKVRFCKTSGEVVN